jgi:hypothetical protein
MKIDISKAFDTLSWEFLLEMLRRRGFGRTFCAWLCGTLRSAYARIMINGTLGAPIQLARGVRQGDPLSPTLYILAMDSFHAILQWAVDRGLLAELGVHGAVPRASIYADDAVLFFRPITQDLEVIEAAFCLFAKSTGLHINLQKKLNHLYSLRRGDSPACCGALQLHAEGFSNQVPGSSFVHWKIAPRRYLASNRQVLRQIQRLEAEISKG